MPDTLERLTLWTPAYDKRSSDPKKDYGIHCVDVTFVVKGKLGATTFMLFTGWYLPQNRKAAHGVLPADVGYHWQTDPYGYGTHNEKCQFTHSGECYYDGSGLAANDLFDKFVAEGIDVVWEHLENNYNEMANA